MSGKRCRSNKLSIRRFHPLTAKEYRPSSITFGGLQNVEDHTLGRQPTPRSSTRHTFYCLSVRELCAHDAALLCALCGRRGGRKPFILRRSALYGQYVRPPFPWFSPNGKPGAARSDGDS